ERAGRSRVTVQGPDLADPEMMPPSDGFELAIPGWVSTRKVRGSDSLVNGVSVLSTAITEAVYVSPSDSACGDCCDVAPGPSGVNETIEPSEARLITST